jgi:hypothetical protein
VLVFSNRIPLPRRAPRRATRHQMRRRLREYQGEQRRAPRRRCSPAVLIVVGIAIVVEGKPSCVILRRVIAQRVHDVAVGNIAAAVRHNGRDSGDSSSSGRSTIHNRGRRALAFGELRARSEEARDHLLLRDTGRLKESGQARSKPSDLFRTDRRSKVRSDTRAICCQRSIARRDARAICCRHGSGPSTPPPSPCWLCAGSHKRRIRHHALEELSAGTAKPKGLFMTAARHSEGHPRSRAIQRDKIDTSIFVEFGVALPR